MSRRSPAAARDRGPSRSFGPSNPNQMAAYDDDASCEVAELLVAQETPYRGGDCGHVLVPRADDSNTWVAAGRVSTDIAKASIERDKEALVPYSCGKDLGVACTLQTFLDHGVDLVTQGGGCDSCLLWEILVELQPHPGDGSSGCSSSRARNAA